MTKEALIIDSLITQGKCFALYRLPMEEKVHFVMQNDDNPLILHDIAQLNDKSGFVFAPFRITDECPIIILRADVSELSDTLIADNSQSQRFTYVNGEEHTHADYQKAFGTFIQSLSDGEHEKLVLSRTQSIPKGSDFSAGEAFMKACDKYIYSYVYIFHTPQSGTWIGSTPEILLSGKGCSWKTIALAGTQVSTSKDSVSWDAKNSHEQELVSIYIKEQLESIDICPKVSNAYTVRAGGLVHLRTDFQFSLPTDKPIGELLSLLHPTPAVSGLPKESAYNFIKENEGYDRKYYSGFLGMLNMAEASDLFVNLRCMHIEKESLTLYAGGGLLPSSNVEDEWSETEYKLETMRTITQ